MIRTLRESKAKLSALVECAAAGEEVIITVRGKPKARLCPLGGQGGGRPLPKQAWRRKLRVARATYSARPRDSSAEVVDDLRGDRT